MTADDPPGHLAATSTPTEEGPGFVQRSYVLVAQRGLKGFLLALLLPLLTLWPASAQQGRIEQGWITSSALTNNLYGDTANRTYRVYLPPGYDTGTKRYPVVYVLHSWYYDENDMVSKLKPALDSMIRQGSIGEIIGVFVNAQNKLRGSWYLSSPVLGDYETYIVRDLVGLIDTHYRTLAARESRGLTGFSMGGWGTVHLALKFPDVFAVAVAEAGRYNSRSQSADLRARQLASYHPTSLSQFDALLPIDWHLCAFQALLSGLLPNAQRPSLYTDWPYEWVNGQALFSESADQRCRQGDVQNGDLPRYLSQPVRLNGLKIVHGTADTDVPVIDAREFTNALSQAGVAFEYEQHSGGHEYRANLALPFLSSYLQGAERYLAPLRLTLIPSADGFQLVFATQTNVQYSVESAALLGPSGTNWTGLAQVSGDGRTATVAIAVQDEAQFFRVKAANSP